MKRQMAELAARLDFRVRATSGNSERKGVKDNLQIFWLKERRVCCDVFARWERLWSQFLSEADGRPSIHLTSSHHVGILSSHIITRRRAYTIQKDMLRERERERETGRPQSHNSYYSMLLWLLYFISYCYSFLTVLNLLIKLYHRYVRIGGKTIVYIHSIGTIRGFRHKMGVLEYIPCGQRGTTVLNKQIWGRKSVVVFHP